MDHSDNAKTIISKHVHSAIRQHHQQANSNYNADIHSPMKEKSIGYTDHMGFSTTEELQKEKKRSTHMLGEAETKKGVMGVVALEERRHWREKVA
ncbi:unnamed protein product [Sphenostylis stenocarpa]|uniref:Uncharacterized protein n=1 Tax=Sphenostylis stenocarpa TaxID=92480 RepID=A0AA86TBF9_9FABA|nr:unnamed protein product [Sphenostylis stenocarpa]